MDNKLATIDRIDYRRVFPWVHLFRAFSIAADFRKLLLAAAGLLAFSAGQLLIADLPFAPSPGAGRGDHRWPWEQSLGYEQFFGDPLTETQGLLVDPAGTLTRMATNWEIVIRPVRFLILPAVLLFRGHAAWAPVAYAWTQLLWALIVWSVFGGAITRIAAVQIARGNNIGLWAALRFAFSRFPSYMAAPLLPIVGVGVFWAFCALAGLVGRIPVAGEILLGILWIVPLLLGFLMTLTLLGLAVGWPLMFATISTEGSDAFDGMSRSFSYVYDRPWHYLWMVLVAMLYGSLVIFLAAVIASALVSFASWGVSAGLNDQQALAVPQGVLAPGAAMGERSMLGDLAGLWTRGVGLLLWGFVYSYFWTITTIIYFVLRQSDDGTPMDEVYVPQAPDRNESLPLVGTAVSDQTVIERPGTEAAHTAEQAAEGESPPDKGEGDAHPRQSSGHDL